MLTSEKWKERETNMKTWRVYYYSGIRSVRWKDVKAKTAEQAIKRARIKNIISLREV